MVAKQKNDWLLKLLAVVIAVMLWFYASSELNPMMEKAFDVSLEYQNQAENAVVLDGPKTVRVTVKGRQNDLLTLRADDFWAGVDLSEADVGSAEYPVQIVVPNNVERYTVSSTRVKLLIEQTEQKTVQVRLETTGALPAGVQLVKMEVNPEVVQISGYEQALNNVSELITEAVDLASITETTELNVALRIPQGVNTANGVVHVRFEVIPAEMKQELVMPIALRNIGDQMTAMLGATTATCILTGTEQSFAEYNDMEQLQLYVDCANLTEGTHTVEIQLENHELPMAIEIVPAQVEVVIAAQSSTGEHEQNGIEDGNGDASVNDQLIDAAEEEIRGT